MWPPCPQAQGPLFPAHSTLRETEAEESVTCLSGSSQDLTWLESVLQGWTPRRPSPCAPSGFSPTSSKSPMFLQVNSEAPNSVSLERQARLQSGPLELPSVFI